MIQLLIYPAGMASQRSTESTITVKQLLNHTSGITPEATGIRNPRALEPCLGPRWKSAYEQLAFAPGTACGYSTFALYHAALVCEHVTGKPYDQFAIESLFKPIGCEHWWFQYFEGGGAQYGRHPSHAMGMPARIWLESPIACCAMGVGTDTQVIPKWFVDETEHATAFG